MSRQLTSGVLGRKKRLILDQFPGAYAAYSFRKLSTTYNGDCCIVRRASDNATMSIGFIDNKIDINSLLNFSQGAAYVNTWFDQTGMGRNAIQTSNDLQPRIVNISGNPVLQNNKISLFFDGDGELGISGNVLIAPILINTNNWSIFSAIRAAPLASDNFGAILNQHLGPPENNRAIFLNYNLISNKYGFFANNIGSYSHSFNVVNELDCVSSIANNDKYYLSVNGNLELLEENVIGYSPLQVNFSIGAYLNSVRSHAGNVSEVIVYRSGLENKRQAIESNIINYYSI